MRNIKTAAVKFSLFLVVYIAGFSGIFSLSAQENQGVPDVCVSGIILDSEQSVAIVNDDTYTIGDSVKNARILDIGDSGIQFEYNGSTFTKQIGEGCEKKAQIQPVPVNKPSIAKSGKKEKKPESFSKNIFKNNALPKDTAARLAGIIRTVAVFVWLIAVILYVYAAFTLQMIANKTGNKDSWLAWIPLANLYLMCVIAQKPWWWLLLLLLPFVSLIIVILLWMGIAEARGKPSWLGILMMIPGVNFIVMGYLAFSS